MKAIAQFSGMVDCYYRLSRRVVIKGDEFEGHQQEYLNMYCKEPIAPGDRVVVAVYRAPAFAAPDLPDIEVAVPAGSGAAK